MEKLLTSIDLAQFGAASAVIGILVFVIWIQWKQNQSLRQELKEERSYNREMVKIMQDQQVDYLHRLRDLHEISAIILDRTT